MTRLSLIRLLGLTALATTLTAQSVPPLLSIARVTVRADRMTEFLEIQKKITDAYRKGKAPMRIVLRGTTGNPQEVITIVALNNYAERDNLDTAVRKALPPEEWTALFARRDQCTVSVRTTIERTLSDLGINAASTVLPKMLREVRTRVRPGKQDEYMALVRNELVPALKKTNVASYRVRQVQYGGSRTEFASVTPLEKWAELDALPGSLEKAMGAEAYKKYLEKVSSLIAGSEYTIYTLVADASYRN